MSMQDPISDMLTRIRNAQKSRLPALTLPSSKLKVAIVKILLDEGYVRAYEVLEGVKPLLTIHLKYFSGKSVIQTIQRVSKPGLRIYRHCKDLPEVMGGLGIAIVSTSQGLMSHQRAKAKGLGGEVICSVA